MQTGWGVESGPASRVLTAPQQAYTRELIEAAPGRDWDFRNFHALRAACSAGQAVSSQGRPDRGLVPRPDRSVVEPFFHFQRSARCASLLAAFSTKRIRLHQARQIGTPSCWAEAGLAWRAAKPFSRLSRAPIFPRRALQMRRVDTSTP
ncbi:hypothetical protein G6F57_021298 [Rhizopus arrhizus]|nr:hypothetical protein G6F57_021298 [Rhizopus arrhizus]